jgi:hypothetical protein
MDTTYRFRFLIYLAAFMLVMSLCFVYAEPLPSPSHLLFQVAPQHAGFLSSSVTEPTFDPAALQVASPVVSPLLLQQLEHTTRSHHGFFRHAKPLAARPLAANIQSESLVLGLAALPSSLLSVR